MYTMAPHVSSTSTGQRFSILLLTGVTIKLTMLCVEVNAIGRFSQVHWECGLSSS